MAQLKAAIVCIVVLYGVDAFFCNGWSFATTEQIIANAQTIDW